MAIVRSGILFAQPRNPDSAQRTPTPRDLCYRQREPAPQDHLAHKVAEFRPMAPIEKTALPLAPGARRLKAEICFTEMNKSTSDFAALASKA